MSLYVDIEKQLGKFRLKVCFDSRNGVLSLMGKSGCGKSMTLKCIAGIEKPDRGRIVLDGITLFDSEKRINLPPQKRKVGLLFQNYALFPDMTALENIYAGANRIKDRQERMTAAKSIMDSFGVSDLSNHYPSQLSGGQQQRIALARILVSTPECLLLDEPFSSLDSHLRFITERETAKVIRDFGKTVILVSHNINEVFRMTDDIAIMDEGRIDIIGEKNHVLSEPVTVNSALLTGWSNISPARITEEGLIFAEDWGLNLKKARKSVINTDNNTNKSDNSDPCFVGIRPESIKIGSYPGDNTFLMKVEAAAANPYDTTLLLKAFDNSRPLTCTVSNEQWQANKAEFINILIPEEAIALLTDKRLLL